MSIAAPLVIPELAVGAFSVAAHPQESIPVLQVSVDGSQSCLTAESQRLTRTGIHGVSSARPRGYRDGPAEPSEEVSDRNPGAE